jgi:hypothetical protein
MAIYIAKQELQLTWFVLGRYHVSVSAGAFRVTPYFFQAYSRASNISHNRFFPHNLKFIILHHPYIWSCIAWVTGCSLGDVHPLLGRNRDTSNEATASQIRNSSGDMARQRTNATMKEMSAAVLLCDQCRGYITSRGCDYDSSSSCWGLSWVGQLRVAVADAQGQFGNPEEVNFRRWKTLPDDWWTP